MDTIKQHLIGRHIDFDLHHPFIDEDERVAIFLLTNLSGQLIGYQQYRPDADKLQHNHPKEGRYFTYKPKDANTLAVWGVESLHLSPGLLFVTEGVFDAARITEKGYSAVAVLTNNPSPQVRTWLRTLVAHKVAICDPGPTGAKLARCGDTAITMSDTDLGAASEERVLEIISLGINNLQK